MVKSLLVACLLLCACAQAQESSSATSVSGFVDTYYSYSINNPSNNLKPNFIYNYNKNNGININLAYIKCDVLRARTRGNLALMAGTYSNANLVNETGVLKNILEANAGVRLYRNLWLDAGIFTSHIGFESAVSKDCWTLTRSLAAENSPYYESGARLHYEAGQWALHFYCLNGWQRMERQTGPSLPSFGSQTTWKYRDLTISYNTYFGQSQFTGARVRRLFHNIYAIVQLNSQCGLIAGFDAGADRQIGTGVPPAVWYTPVVMGRYHFSDKFSATARAEYYADKNGTVTGNEGFAMASFSANLDYRPHEKTLLRLEARRFNSRTPVFKTATGISDNDTVITLSLSNSL